VSPLFDRIGACKLVPVIVLQDPAHAAPLAEALMAGELPCAEVTYRTAAAGACIKIMAQHAGLLVGAGTVIKVDQVKEAMDLGAEFIVSPGFFPKVVAYCVEQGIPVAPGVCTPTDIGMALEFGLSVVKFFPAEAAGGLAALKAVSAPFGAALRYIPTGGICEDNLASYLAFPRVLACGGSWMIPDDLVRAGRFQEVGALIGKAVALARRSSAGGPE
jgi:2-dehydro-3-deoxyphosphogluconate aldolase/(4S)-4-hydroxy-2-oxoglutarate aldolase